jgi:hypothetical protein
MKSNLNKFINKISQTLTLPVLDVTMQTWGKTNQTSGENASADLAIALKYIETGDWKLETCHSTMPILLGTDYSKTKIEIRK